MGSVTQHDGQVGVQADLVNTADGTELWGAHYDRKMADVTEVQGDITRDIAARLRGRPAGDQQQQQKMGDAGTTNPEAYRLYLEGRSFGMAARRTGSRKAFLCFNRPSPPTRIMLWLMRGLRILTTSVELWYRHHIAPSCSARG
jgi:hypothetical protein